MSGHFLLGQVIALVAVGVPTLLYLHHKSKRDGARERQDHIARLERMLRVYREKAASAPDGDAKLYWQAEVTYHEHLLEKARAL